MEVDVALAAVMGLVIGSVVTGVFLGNLAHQNYEKYLRMKALAFDFEGKWLDALEGNTDRMWILRGEGAEDPYVVRGRPDIHEKASSEVSEDTDVVDLTWAAGDE